MKNYDYQKAKKLISENEANLKSAALGMHEDWFWTAQDVWVDGEYKHDLPDNADEMQDKYIAARKGGMSMFLTEKGEDGLAKLNPKYSELQKHCIGGIYGSDWATPTLQLCFKDGTEKMIEVSKGENTRTPPPDLLGPLSQPVQESITPIS